MDEKATMQTQRYDWLFLSAVVVVLMAFISTSIQAFGGDNITILGAIATIAAILGNIAASRHEQKEKLYAAGRTNPLLIGAITAALLYVVQNVITYILMFSLLSEEGQFVQRRAPFLTDNTRFAEFVILSSSTVAALFMSVISIVAGTTLIARIRRHSTATIVATLGYIGIALVIRLAALLHGDIDRFRLFRQIGWGDVALGVVMNLSVVSLMLWLGVVLVRGRRTGGNNR